MIALPSMFVAKLANFLRSPFLYVILLFIAVAVGTFFYIRHSTNQQIERAVANADAEATVATYEAKEKVEDILIPLLEAHDRKVERTRQEYEYVRREIYQAPEEDRTTPAPRLIIDTLNHLERLSRQRQEGGVPDDEADGRGVDVQGVSGWAIASDRD